MGLNQDFRNLNLYNRKIGILISSMLSIASLVSAPLNANAAESSHVKSKTVQLYMKKYEKNNVVFYSGRSLSRTTSVSSEDYFKGSPYICTPSGFGRTSHCHNRSGF
ncbi:hypothetical protein GA0061102_103021 [Rhizobium miluonense]|uniref:Uncharacterized protein n=1 Tax=Rhizobium miluonense TaxID=411945 RepID=A0A1C3WH94_9HYPH|nr:hypothetical protein GA0061102_103021 [Rhizobium miluonense]